MKAGYGQFALSEGAPLKYLVLHDVSLNYDSPRFPGLFTLHLSRAAAPNSLETLLQILSGTSRLEQLVVGQKKRIVGQAAEPGQRITLEYLKELKITDVANGYCAALLTSIYTRPASELL